MTNSNESTLIIHSPATLANLIERLPAADNDQGRREQILARTICRGLADKGFGWLDCFTWGDLFTDQELETGLVDQIPATWFVDEHSATFSVTLTDHFVDTWSAAVAGEVKPIKLKHSLSDPATQLKRAGIGPGARLRSICGGFEVVINAIGKHKALGFWVKWPAGTFTPADVRGERVLALNVADWQIIEFGEG